MKIRSKIAIVTGASRGLGASISNALVNEGAKVYGIAGNMGLLESVQENLGNHFIPVILDITQENAVKEWIENTFSKENIPEILINNGVWDPLER